MKSKMINNFILLLILSLFLMVGCAEIINNNEKPPEQTKDDKEQKEETKKYNKELAGFFPKKPGTTWYYYGLAEYGHVMTLKEITEEKDKLILHIEGYLDDAVADPDPQGNRTFKLKYIINENSIKEEILYKETGEKIFYSTTIIPNMIIFKSPLKIGTTWEQKFEYQGNEYTAVSTITKIEKIINSKDNPNEDEIQYTVTTLVKDIEGFRDRTYKEIRTFAKGKGLIAFSKSLGPFKNGKGDLVDPNFMFGYRLSMLKENPLNK